jgi:hypothetical protein
MAISGGARGHDIGCYPLYKKLQDCQYAIQREPISGRRAPGGLPPPPSPQAQGPPGATDDGPASSSLAESLGGMVWRHPRRDCGPCPHCHLRIWPRHHRIII